jgi:ATP-binding cassette subfamily B protein
MSEHQFFEEEFESQMNTQTLWRIFKQGWKHWPLMLVFIVCISLVSLMESYFTYLAKRMIDEGVGNRDLELLQDLAVQYGLWVLLFAVFVFGFIVAAGTLGHRVQYDLRKQMFNHLQKLSLSYYNRTPTGWIMSRVTSDASRVGDLVSWGFLDMIWTVTSVVTAIGFHVLHQLAHDPDCAGDDSDSVEGGD